MNKIVEDIKKEKTVDKIDKVNTNNVKKMRASIPKTSVLRVREEPTPNAKIIRDLIDGDIVSIDINYTSQDWVKVKDKSEYVLKIWMKDC